MSFLFDYEAVFAREAESILERLRTNFERKDLIATGRTVNSLRAEIYKEGFALFGADWIEAAEYGRGPAKQAGGDFKTRLLEWARARGFPLARVEWLRYNINRFGTRLYRGQDPVFTGKQSGVLTEILNRELVEVLQEKITFAVTKEFSIFVRK